MTLHPRWERLIHFAATYRADIVRAELTRTLAEHDAERAGPTRGCGAPLPPWECGETMPAGVVALCDACAWPTLPAGQAPPGFRVAKGWHAIDDEAECCDKCETQARYERLDGMLACDAHAVQTGALEPLPAEQPAPTCGCDARGRSCGCRYPSACSCDSPRGERCMCRCHAQTASLEACTMAIPPRTWGKTRIMDTAQAAPDGGRLSERIRANVPVARAAWSFKVRPEEIERLADEVAALEARLAAAERDVAHWKEARRTAMEDAEHFRGERDAAQARCETWRHNFEDADKARQAAQRERDMIRECLGAEETVRQRIEDACNKAMLERDTFRQAVIDAGKAKDEAVANERARCAEWVCFFHSDGDAYKAIRDGKPEP